ncbi:phage tail protein [Aeromonas hydrophila]
MYWLDNNTGIATAPDVPAVISATKRFFTNGGSGVPPSVPEDFWFHMIQEELLGVLTMAGIAPAKGDLNQIAKAIQSIAFSAYPVGAPIPWPTAVPPTGFLAMTGQSFSATTYPKLAAAYPSLVLPDMRAEFIRGWDNARGIDVGRTILSSQGDAIRNLIGSIQTDNGWMVTSGTGVMRPVGSQSPLTKNQTTTGTVSTYAAWDMDASRAVPTASENRPRSVAFNYIVRAA